MYRLTKLSSPVFDFHCEDERLIESMLRFHFCFDCVDECDDEPDSIPALLDTPCGTEFIYESNYHPNKQLWWCEKKMDGYLVCLRIGDFETNRLVPYMQWEGIVSQQFFLESIIHDLKMQFVKGVLNE